MSTPARRIYLDNAATTWPKPPGVIEAVVAYMTQNGASAGRGGYRESIESGRLLERTRLGIRRMIRAPANGVLAFAACCTDALNMALHGFLRQGDHVVTTAAEHNSVLRPLEFAREQTGIDYTVVAVDSTGELDLNRVAEAFEPRTRLLVATHASNVTGTIYPIHELANLAHQRGARCLIDVAQTAGLEPIDVAASRVDLVAGSGHKGLLGPLGTGFVYVADELVEELLPLRQGGTGTSSESPRHPLRGTEKFEPGNHNMPGIAGLLAGLEYLQTHGSSIRDKERYLTDRILRGLEALPRIQTFGRGAEAPGPRTGVVAFRIDGFDCHDAAHILEQQVGVQIRAGLHCAPRVHEALGAGDGTLRASVGPFTTDEDIDRLLEGVADLVQQPSFG